MAKAHKILWTGPALTDLRSARDYISRDSPQAARRLAARVRARVSALKTHPLSGRIVPELPGHGLREIIVPPYRIVYRLQGWEIVILRVWHGRRDLSAKADSL